MEPNASSRSSCARRSRSRSERLGRKVFVGSATSGMSSSSRSERSSARWCPVESVSVPAPRGGDEMQARDAMRRPVRAGRALTVGEADGFAIGRPALPHVRHGERSLVTVRKACACTLYCFENPPHACQQRAQKAEGYCRPVLQRIMFKNRVGRANIGRACALRGRAGARYLGVSAPGHG